MRRFVTTRFPLPDVLVYLIGVLEIVGGLLLASGLLVRVAALALGGDMVGAIVVSGIGRAEYISLTLAPALLVAMLFLIHVGSPGPSRQWHWAPRDAAGPVLRRPPRP